MSTMEEVMSSMPKRRKITLESGKELVLGSQQNPNHPPLVQAEPKRRFSVGQHAFFLPNKNENEKFTGTAHEI